MTQIIVLNSAPKSIRRCRCAVCRKTGDAAACLLICCLCRPVCDVLSPCPARTQGDYVMRSTSVIAVRLWRFNDFTGEKPC